MDIASALRARLVERIGHQRYDLWFGSTARIRLESDHVTIEVANPFCRDWITANLSGDLISVLQDVTGRSLPIRFQVDASLAASDSALEDGATLANGSARGAKASQGPTSNGGGPADGADDADDRAIPARSGRPAARAPVARSASPGRALALLTDFVVGQSNRLAHTAATLAAERPGQLSPLWIHGPTGGGKTHLLEGVLAEARKLHPGLRGIYLTAERFTTSFLEALHGKGLPSFRQKYRSADLLLLDDIQFFLAKPATLDELLHTIESLATDGKQLVVASGRAPADLAGLGGKLVDLFSAGMVCQMHQADFEVRQGLVERFGRQLELSIPSEVRSLLATEITGGARELCGALKRIKIASLAENRPIGRELVEESIAELKEQMCVPVQLPDIERAVCDVFGVSPDALQSHRKSDSASFPRTLAMWLARKHTRAALSEIGTYFGRRSHSSVISAQKKVEGWMLQQVRLTAGRRTCRVDEAIRRVEERLLRRA